MASPTDRSAAREPRCSPLCGAFRAYGREKATRPESWWLHENGCPMRDHLRLAMVVEVRGDDDGDA